MEANVLDRFEFRSVRANEAEEVAEIEKICFPPHEACSKKDMFERVERISAYIWGEEELHEMSYPF